MALTRSNTTADKLRINAKGQTTFYGIVVRLDAEDGFHAEAGAWRSYGYCDTLADLLAEIVDDFGDIDIPLDTPSIDDIFHRHEMAI